MATITIEGTVTSVFSKGIRVTEKHGEKETRYTIWAGKATEGDRVRVSGEFSARLETFTGRDGSERQAVGLHVNNATITTAQPANGPQSAPDTDWASDSTIPF